MASEPANDGKPLTAPVAIIACCNKCPAWEDGRHFWEPHFEASGGSMGPHGLGSARVGTWFKRCLCGAKVRQSAAPALPTPRDGQPGRPSPVAPHQDVETATDETAYVTPGRPRHWGPGLVDQLGANANANGQQWIQLTPEQRADNDRAMAAQQAQSPAASAALGAKKDGQG